MTENRYKADATLKLIARQIKSKEREIQSAKDVYNTVKLPSGSFLSGGYSTNRTNADKVGENVLLREQTQKRLATHQEQLNDAYRLFFSLLFYCPADVAQIIQAYYLNQKSILNISFDMNISVDSVNRKLAVGRDAVYKRIADSETR